MHKVHKLFNGEIDAITLSKDYEIFYIREDEVDDIKESGFYTNRVLGYDDVDQRKISYKEAFLLLAKKYS